MTGKLIEIFYESSDADSEFIEDEEGTCNKLVINSGTEILFHENKKS